MPLISRVMIKFALCYFLIGVVLGALMLVNKATGFYPGVWMLLPVHIEIMIFGWIIQFTLGTSYWMLPRLVKGKPRGNEKSAIMIPVLLNFGILLMIASYLFFPNQEIKMIGRISEALVVPVFGALHWKRVSKQLHDD